MSLNDSESDCRSDLEGGTCKARENDGNVQYDPPKDSIIISTPLTQDHITETAQRLSQHQHPVLAKRIGYTSSIFLLLTYIATIASFVFITWLWYADHDNPTWRRITLNNWTTRAVTIASIALRTSFTTHGLICTSMLAAIALQQGEVPLRNAALVSLLRYTNSGPQSLVLSLLGRRGRTFHITSVILLGIFATTLLINVTSTALLSDLRFHTLPGFRTHTTVS